VLFRSSTGLARSFAYNTPNALETFSPPVVDAENRFASVREAAELAHENGMAIVAGLRGPFAFLMWHFLGMVDGMMALVSDPGVIELALQHYMSFHLPAAEHLVTAGVDAVFLTEDLGSTTGPLISPVQYRRFFLDHLTEIVEKIRGGGAHVILHSDGDIREYLPDLISSGISALHPIERSANMSLTELKSKYAGRVALCGNVDTKTVLCKGTSQEVHADVERCITQGAPGGGYVLCSDHSISNQFPVENVLTMIESGKQLGKYSI